MDGRLPAWRSPWARPLAAVAALPFPLWLLRGAIGQAAFPGSGGTEGWGRMFVSAQVARWATRDAPWGRADLLGWPSEVPFWPVDPMVQIVEAPLAAALGGPAALTVVMGLLLWLAGYGTARLAEAAGAGLLGATTGGLAVQASPFLLRHISDTVVEVCALGVMAVAALAILRAHQAPGLRRLLGVAAAVAVLAGTSPYYAVHLVLCCALAAVATPRRWRTWLGVAAAGALACGLLLAPLATLEGGDQGRLGPTFSDGGYRTVPSDMVTADGRPAPRRRQGSRPAGPDEGDPPGPHRPSAAARLLHRAPGSAVAMLATVLGLAVRRSRRWALLALVLFIGGPGPGLLGRGLGQQVADVAGPLDRLLGALPLTSSMGNPTRLLGPFLLAAAVAAALLATRWRWLAPVVVGGALFEATSTLPAARAPIVPVVVDDAVLDALSGPTIVFPSGDPPAWQATVGPKEVLFLAGRAGVPVAYDYGRGRWPADVSALVRLSAVAGVPIGRFAVDRSKPLPPDEDLWPALPFESLLVLDDRLEGDERTALREWLAAHAHLRQDGSVSSAWDLPFTDALPARPATAPPPR